MLKTLRRMKWKGRRSQKENRKNQKLPRTPNLQRNRKRRALKGICQQFFLLFIFSISTCPPLVTSTILCKGKRKKKSQKSRKSVAGSPPCITTMRATLLRRSPSRKGREADLGCASACASTSASACAGAVLVLVLC